MEPSLQSHVALSRYFVRGGRAVFQWCKRPSAKPVLLMATMLAVVVSGFVLVAFEQNELAKFRDSARQMRLARHSLMELNDTVVDALASHAESAGPAYEAALTKVMAHPAAGFPGSVQHNNAAIGGAAAVSELVEKLSETMERIRLSKWDDATRQYVAGGSHGLLLELTNAYVADLAVAEHQYETKQYQVSATTIALLLLQIATGSLSVIAFVFAVSKSDRESKARTVAVETANETREQVERLFEMADMLQSASDYTDANEVLRSAASELLFGFSGALYIYNNSRDRLVLSTTWDRDGYDDLTDTITNNQCWALKRGKPHINRPHSRKLCCEHHSSGQHALEIPMMARGEILGLLQVYAEGDLAEERLMAAQGVATAIADAMSLALANISLREKLRSQALRDPLTGLYNRRYMEDTLQRFVRLSEREQREFSVIMIDLDHFKRLNDQFGHAKGDAVLRDSAAAILNQLRETDVACRYGGEELIVLLPDCGLEMAVAKAENIRLNIEALTEPNSAKVSASIGVAGFPLTSKSAKELVACADAALYQAKQNGRNQVVRATVRGGKVPANGRERRSAEAPADAIVREAAE